MNELTFYSPTTTYMHAQYIYSVVCCIYTVWCAAVAERTWLKS